tara:strand:+ start:1123 stop:1305 length:183 start_codon:yes stop_codon:yes gene_type:complete
MTVSGAKIWLSIEEMELILSTLPKFYNDSEKNKRNLLCDELWVKLRLKLDGIEKYNEVEN